MSLANHYNYVVKVIENDRLQAENKSLREYLERDTALVAQQAAVIEQMREALTHYAEQDVINARHYPPEIAKRVLAIQPCPEVLNKVRADAVREFVKPYSDSHTYIGLAVKQEAELVAQRIEQGEM